MNRKIKVEIDTEVDQSFKDVGINLKKEIQIAIKEQYGGEIGVSFTTNKKI